MTQGFVALAGELTIGIRPTLAPVRLCFLQSNTQPRYYILLP
jgi:hypothetical protein